MTVHATDRPDGADSFESVRRELLAEPGVEEGRLFGAHGLKANAWVFAMRMQDALVVKLPASRVAELVASGRGQPFTSGGGRVMREWVSIPAGRGSDWLALAREALRFNREATGQPKRPGSRAGDR